MAMSMLETIHPLWRQRCHVCGRMAGVILDLSAPHLREDRFKLDAHDEGREHCPGSGQQAPQANRPDAKYAMRLLLDDHLSYQKRVPQMLALFFNIDTVGRVQARMVSVGPPGWGGSGHGPSRDMSVNEVRKGHLTRDSVYALTGNEMSRLKHCGELPINDSRWMVMVPAIYTNHLGHVQSHASLTDDSPQAPTFFPSILALDAMFRHINRHPGCTCPWAMP
jgi:hypothetical protein